MADTQNSSIGSLTNNSKIVVNVDHALDNVLVVSYAFQSKLFQGVLLDATNRFLPSCTDLENKINNANLEVPVIQPSIKLPPSKLKPSIHINKKNSSSKQSKDLIKEVPITENLDEVKPDQENQSNPKLEAPDADVPFYSLCRRFTYFQDILLQRSLTVQKASKPTKNNKNQKMTVRLRPRQVLCSKCKSICNENSENVHSNKNQNPDEPNKSPRLVDSSQEHPSNSPSKIRTTLVAPLSRLNPGDITNTLNGTNSNESMAKWLERQGSLTKEGLFDQAAVDKQMVLRKKRSVGSMEDLWDETVFEEASKKAKTPIIKISFGSPGEGTVLKIPSKLQTGSASENDDNDKELDVAKAFKKALKKAKKEAKRKFSLDGSPDHSVREASPSNQINYKKHRHKVKHKKKHKGEKSEEEAKCQKLSINLKRLTTASILEAEESSGGESSHSSEEVPEFPPSSPLGVCQDVTSCKTEEGLTLHVGDIVWGKVHGFPWWPGKVQSLCMSTENKSWDAQVSWYGSATSSLMPCNHLSPFLETFKSRYNKKKKSTGYREAIKQATSEASSKKFDLPHLPLAEIYELLAL